VPKKAKTLANPNANRQMNRQSTISYATLTSSQRFGTTYLAPSGGIGDSDNDESSVEFINQSQSDAGSRGTEAFLNDPALSDHDEVASDARSALNMEPDHHIYGNRFEKHDPNSRDSFA